MSPHHALDPPVGYPAGPPRDVAPKGVRVGDVLVGKYQVVRQLGAGGMGEVVLARHLQLGRLVAIKTLQREGLGNPSLRERFRREAMAAATLKSDHIAEVFDVGELPDATPFMVMEYLEGCDAAAYLRRRGPLPVHEVVGLVSQLCEGLAVAHRAGVVHRDLKPANLFLVPKSGGVLVKILDFGIARAPTGRGGALTGAHAVPAGVGAAAVAAPGAGAQITSAGEVLGSSRYMAPEQMESPHDVDARADIWSIGALAYRLLTNRNPFEGESLDELFVAMSTRAMVPLSQARPDMPPLLAEVFERCLNPRRDERWPSVDALVAALAAASMRGAPVPSLAVPAGPAGGEPAGRDVGAQRALKAAAIAFGLLFGAGLVCSLTTPCSRSRRSGKVASGESLPLRALGGRAGVDPVDLVGVVRERARKVDASAELTAMATSNGKSSGLVDLEREGAVTFTFNAPRAQASQLVITLARGAMTLSSAATPGQGVAVPDPTCKHAQVVRAALAGMPLGASAKTTNYAATPRPIWQVNVKQPTIETILMIDAQTCQVVQAR